MDALTVYLDPEPRLVPLNLTSGCTAQVKELTPHTGASALFDFSPKEEGQTRRINTDPISRGFCLSVSINIRKPASYPLLLAIGRSLRLHSTPFTFRLRLLRPRQGTD